ncbi:MAG: PAS domain-containing sensor histidine kinase [Gemmatimonadaceae bacterium]
MDAIDQLAPGGVAHESGELHRLLVETVDDYAIFALDPQGYVISWNAGAQRIKGYKPNEIIGKHFSIFYPEEKRAEGFPQYELKEAARVGRFEDEGWRIRKDGSRLWANVVITALHNRSGALVGYAKVTRDLTERREAEDALRASEERFRLLVQGVRDYAIFMLDPTGHITTWNEGAQRIKGYTSDEAIGKHFSIFYPPEDVASGKPPRELKIAVATGAYEEEGWRVRRDGSRFWASVVITALRTPGGELAGFSKVTRDLTERRAAQDQAIDAARRAAAEEAARRIAEEVRARTERLQKLTASLSGARSIEDVTRVISDESLPAVGAAAGALGLVDKSTAAINLVADRGYSNLPMWARSVAVADDHPMSIAVRTGEVVTWRSREERDRRFPKLAKVLAAFEAGLVIPLRDRTSPAGALVMHFAPDTPLTEDLTEFVKAFAQQAAQALDRAALYQAEQQARARADEANRAKSQFLAAMSHELRTPLNAVGGYADLIALGLRGPVTEEQRSDLERIKRSQQHLLGIINDILSFARTEAGQTVYQNSPVVIKDVLEAVCQMIEPQAKAKGLKFTVVQCPANVVAWADRAKVDQILLNLLSNAVKFTDAGTVSLECEWQNEGRIPLRVRDTGAGISEHEVDRIFEPFVQVGRSLTQPHQGTGLGLAISRDLARGMGGDITVTSKLGEGSVFTLSLPQWKAEGEAHEPPPSQPA